MDNGYRPHLAFPDTNKVYTSDKLFGPFARRLPDPRRPDYQTFLQNLGLPLDCTEMDVQLYVSGGILATDSYEFVSPIYLENNYFDLNFFVAGWRYYEGERVIDHLRKGNVVDFSLDSENTEDDKAVLVMTVNGEKLGYIPAFYSGWMYEIIQKNATTKQKLKIFIPKRCHIVKSTFQLLAS
ncbi:HIRAN domain-containing protein [Virgibacillus ainsalahensis]